MAAAEALGHYGTADDVARALPVLVDLADCHRHGVYVALMALNALDALDTKVAPYAEQIRALPTEVQGPDSRSAYGIPRLIKKTLADLGR